MVSSCPAEVSFVTLLLCLLPVLTACRPAFAQVNIVSLWYLRAQLRPAFAQPTHSLSRSLARSRFHNLLITTDRPPTLLKYPMKLTWGFLNRLGDLVSPGLVWVPFHSYHSSFIAAMIILVLIPVYKPCLLRVVECVVRLSQSQC